MPTYEDLRAYFEESEDLKVVARHASSIPIVRGFTLSLDPLWCAVYDLEDGLTTIPIHDWIWERGWSSRLYGLIRRYEAEVAPWCQSGIQFQGYRRRDLYRLLKDWPLPPMDAPNLKQKHLPVIMTIVYRPLQPPSQLGSEIEDDQAALQRLIGIVREANVPVRLEERPQARLALGSGDRIHTNRGKSGTLGGVLDDRANGKSYAVTCAHVATIGDTLTSPSPNFIGHCRAAVTLLPLQQPRTCDPVNLAVPAPIPSNGPEINMLDCALIELTTPISRLPIGGIANPLSPGQSVILHGAETGTTRHVLGPLCMSYSFRDGGQHFCFRDSIELIPQPWGPFGGTLGKWMTKMPTQGDSGGWILTEDNPPQWAGLFFGENGRSAFAIRASWVHQLAERAIGCNLQV
jgi:hypothetical protein